jgi:uncharacterized protein (DUF2336 family)
MSAAPSLIRELEDAIHGGSSEKRVSTLRRITDLFLDDPKRLSEQQVAVFDDVLGHLIESIESTARAELGARLAPVDNAPLGVLRRLAHDDEIEVASPVLVQSARLTADDLISVARTKSQAHLFAISGRAQLETSLTDVLVERGDRNVFLRLADNSGARFSDTGFETLVKRSEMDETLAQKVGLRPDLPSPLFRDLLSRATEAVRSRMLAQAGPQCREQIQRVLASISLGVEREAADTRDTDIATAQRLVILMQRKGELDETALLKFAKANQYLEMIAAFALLCSASFELIERLIHSESREVFLIPCKAAGFAWPTVHAILKCRTPGHVLADHVVERAKSDYRSLSQVNAQRVLRFWQVRQTTAKDNDIHSPGADNASARHFGAKTG